MFDDRELRRMARQMRLALAALTEEQPTRGGSRGRGRRTGEQWFGAEDPAEHADQRRRGEDPRRASRAGATDQEDARTEADPGRTDSPASDDEPTGAPAVSTVATVVARGRITAASVPTSSLTTWFARPGVHSARPGSSSAGPPAWR